MKIKLKSVLILDASFLYLRTSRSTSVQHAEGESGIYRKALHSEEIRDAEEATIRKVQAEIFPEEYKALKSKKTISPKGPLIKLSPRIDGTRMELFVSMAD